MSFWSERALLLHSPRMVCGEAELTLSCGCRWRSTKAGVSPSDLKHGLHRIGTNITMDEALAIVNTHGGRDGRISLHEFMDMLASVA